MEKLNEIIVRKTHLFSVIMSVIFLYIFIGHIRALVTSAIWVSFWKSVLMTCWFITLTVVLVGARNNVCGFVWMFLRIFFLCYMIIGRRYQRVPVNLIDLCFGWNTMSKGCLKEEIKFIFWEVCKSYDICVI